MTCHTFPQVHPANCQRQFIDFAGNWASAVVSQGASVTALQLLPCSFSSATHAQ